MRIWHVNHSDILGGAARAAYRIHGSLTHIGVNSRMRVVVKASDDDTVVGGAPQSRFPMQHCIRNRMTTIPLKCFQTDNPIIHSPAWLGIGLGPELNRIDADIIHLHWLGPSTLSVEEIGRLNKPVVWTFHDMWAFCGAEHYTTDGTEARFRVGYSPDNRPPSEQGWDLNRWVWKRKQRSWREPITIVCPSQWLANCARESLLFRNSLVAAIPNPVDLNRWRPLPKDQVRSWLGLPQNQKVVLFGAIGGMRDLRKGGNLLVAALEILAKQNPQMIQLAIFGQSKLRGGPRFPFPTRWLGRLHDDLSLAVVYSAADAFILPSRQDNLPNTGIEALACGVPVVAFNTCGLPDIVCHQENGWLAHPFDIEDLALGIHWVLKDRHRHKKLSENARKTAEDRFAEKTIATQYHDLYNEILEAKLR